MWAERARARGWRIAYVPGARVLHSHEYTVRQVYERCRAEARTRLDAGGREEGWNLLWKAWPRQTARDLARLASEGRPWTWPRAAVYRFAQFAGMRAGGRP